MENVPYYYYCYTDKSEVSTGNRYVRKEYDGIWKKFESEVIIRDEASKLLGFKIHFQADLRNPDLEELTVAPEDMDAPDFRREHPRNAAERRRFE
nr:hypothetical protein Itr_chr11CG21180 [Ipomoea trifida]